MSSIKLMIVDGPNKSLSDEVEPKNPPVAIEPVKPSKSFRKGALVRVDRKAYISSIEAISSDDDPPSYIFEGPGEVLLVKGEYAQIRWRLPVPDVWLRIDQLVNFS